MTNRRVLLTTFSLPAEAIAREQPVRRPEIEADRFAAHSTDWTMPDLWIANPDCDAVGVEAAILEHVRAVALDE